ncbi:MAG: TonB-dependent receptor [Flavobacteriaceae bacterium]|nr:TonB-dependent receptor [Flavobacteriaceae bacterium]
MWGQTLGVLSGRVLEAVSDDPIFGATVLLEATDIAAITDEKGYFQLVNIPVKSYNVQVSYLGYQTQYLYNVVIKSIGNSPLVIGLEQQIEVLDQVVVNSNPFSRSAQTPLSSQTFSAVEIETYPGGNNDITSVVQSMPGVSPSVGGFRNDLIIRGGAPNETVYYLDDIEIPNLNHFSTQGSAGGPVGLVNVSFIDQVTLSSSSFGARYDNPLSGVLQFRQREGNYQEFGGNIRIGASEAGITIEGPLIKERKNQLDNTTFLFSLRRSYLQFVFELIGLPIRPDYWDYQWKIKHQIDQYNTLEFIGIGSIDDFRLEPDQEFNAENQTILEQSPIIQQQSTTVGLTWRKKDKSSNGYSLTTFSSNRLKNVYSRFIDNVSRKNPTFINDSHEWETKIRFRRVQLFGDWKTEFGLVGQNSDYQNITTIPFENIDYSSQITFLKYGFYGSVSTNLFKKRMTLSLGVRTDADSFSTGSELMNNISPRLSVSYVLSPSRKTKFNASLGRYYKMPLYTSLGFQNDKGMYINKNAQYTRSEHIVAGFEYNPNRATIITAEGFLKNYSQYPISVKDDVSLANKGGGFEVMGNEDITTDGKGRTYGLEVLYQRKLFKGFYGILAYTFFFSEFSGLDGILKPSIWDNRHLISFNGGFKLNRNWELSWRWRFSGSTLYIPYDPVASISSYPELIIDSENVGKENLGSFNIADLRIDKKWNFPKTALGVYIEVQNFLAQSIPSPEQLGYNRDDEGNILSPLKLVKIESSQDGGIPIPSIGLVLYF